MTRERIAWSVSLLLVTLTAFRLSPTLANRDEDYKHVRSLTDVEREVERNYVDPVDMDAFYQAEIDGALASLDPYTVYVPPAKKQDFDNMLGGTFKGVGIQLDQKDNGDIEVITPIEGSPAHRAGVQAGDLILKVNDTSVAGMKLEDVTKLIQGDMGTDVTLTVRHEDGQVVPLTMKRDEIKVPMVKGYERNADNTWDYFVSQDPKIGYLRLMQFVPDSAETIRPLIDDMIKQGMKGFILDLRYNPGGQLDQAVEIVDMFLHDANKTIVSTQGRNRPQEIRKSTGVNPLPDFPMVVLVNEHSASASEIVSGSLKDNGRAIIVGTRTYGKGSVQEVIPMEDQGELKMTVAYYYLPSGRLVHKKKDAKDWGVDPDVNVPMDDEAEKCMEKERLDQESFRHLTTRPTTDEAEIIPSTGPATDPSAATGPIDPQLQAAVDVLLAKLILKDQPATAPATMNAPDAPATAPANN